MPRSEKQKLKLYYIIDLFKRKSDEEHPISITDIIEYLAGLGIKAERKSIYRDIEAMGELGYEIIQVHNKRFSYYLASSEFEIAELRLLVDAVQSSRFITKKKSNELIKKLESLTTEYAAESLQNQVYVTNRIKSSNESIYYNVDSINNAIREDVKITFTYFDWDMSKRKVLRHNGAEYIISPWALIWDNEYYYLIGYDTASRKIKHYRVDRMLSIGTRKEPRDGREAFNDVDIAEYAQRFFNMYDGDITTVVLSCSKKVVNAVIDRFGKNLKFTPEPDGLRFKVEVQVAVSPVFLSWVFMFSGQIRIESPEWVDGELRSMAKWFLY